jgi:hypothetical protein
MKFKFLPCALCYKVPCFAANFNRRCQMSGSILRNYKCNRSIPVWHPQHFICVDVLGFDLTTLISERRDWFESASQDRLLSNKSPLWRDENLYFALPLGYSGKGRAGGEVFQYEPAFGGGEDESGKDVITENNYYHEDEDNYGQVIHSPAKNTKCLWTWCTKWLHYKVWCAKLWLYLTIDSKIIIKQEQ